MPASEINLSHIATVVAQKLKHLPEKTIALETLRTQHLIQDWLHHVEQFRLPFHSTQQEVPIAAQLQGLSFSLRIDRMEQTDTGHLLIDYKTGNSVNNQGWFDARLTEPQMPLYACMVSEPVSGVAFAKVVTGKPSLISKSCDVLLDKPRQKPPLNQKEWQDLQHTWQTKLSHLADEIIQGHAELHLETAVLSSPTVGFCRIYDHL